jgi:hypothetical protein
MKKEQPKKPIEIIDSDAFRVDTSLDEGLVIKNFQDIPDSFIQGLKDETAIRPRNAEMRKVASIPTGIVEAWKRQGFDVHKETAQAIVARLSREDLTAFITDVP